GNSKVVYLFEKLVDLALAEVKLLYRLIHIRLVIFGNDHGAFGQEEDPRFSGKHIDVILRRNRQGENALADSVEIDLHHHGLSFFVFTLILIVLVFVLIGGSFVVGLLVFILFLILILRLILGFLFLPLLLGLLLF